MPRASIHDQIARAIVRDVLIAVAVAIGLLLAGGSVICWLAPVWESC